jgi:programmed cell death 8 (apoptosis-inducing factor)
LTFLIFFFQAIPEHVTYLLVGAGTASFSAYRAIKAMDPKAKILIIGEEARLDHFFL